MLSLPTQDDVRRITSTFDKAAVEQEALQGKIEELELHNTNSLRELKRTSDGKQVCFSKSPLYGMDDVSLISVVYCTRFPL